VTTDDIRIRRLEPDDWRTYREVRLASLRDAPNAFGSTAAEEAPLSAARWRDRLTKRAQFAACLGDGVVGTAGGITSDDGSAAELVSMWVAASARGRGIGDALVTAVLAWAAAEGFGQVQLWVSEDNVPAERLYARHGFRRTGAVQPVVADQPDRLEFEMTRPT
jgi:GNAT superfamily N-acetyltransferase